MLRLKGGVPLKRKYIYVTSFFLAIALFTIVFGLSYQQAVKKENEQRDKKKSEAKIVDTTDSIRTTNDMEFIMETYNGTGDSIQSETLQVPAELAGKTRRELEQYMQEYVSNPPLKESLNGLTDFEIVSFSAKRLVVRKTYQNMAKENRYFLTIKNDEVVAYYNDKKTVYQYTGIASDNLSEDEQAKLAIGYYVKDEEQLFSILENYSS